MLDLLRLTFLFAITAVAEIIGCYLPWLVLRQGKPLYLLIPAAIALALFAWLLTLHPTAAGRTYEIGRATSELQSLMRISYAVFCLKKKKIKIKPNSHREKKNNNNKKTRYICDRT